MHKSSGQSMRRFCYGPLNGLAGAGNHDPEIWSDFNVHEITISQVC